MTSLPTNVLVLGPEGAGKSLLLKRIHYLSNNGMSETFQDIPSTVPTVGNNIVNITHNKRPFEIREVGGSMAPIWKNYYKETKAVIYVISKCNQFQLSAACMLFLDVLSHPLLADKPFLVLFNKVDFESHFSLVELKKIMRFDDIIKHASQTIRICETSCVDKIGFHEIFTWLHAIPVVK